MESLRAQAEELIQTVPGLVAAAERVVAAHGFGEHKKRRSGPGEKFWQFREYEHSDRPQDIDWRQSAKGKRLFVRQKEWQNAQQYYFWLDRSADMEYGSGQYTKKQTAQILLMALALLMTRAGEHITGPEIGRPGRGEKALEELGEYLLSPAGENPLSLSSLSSLSIPRNSFMILTGDFWDPPEYLERAFEELSLFSENALVLQILDPAELDLPFRGHTLFEDMQGGNAMRIDHVSAVRAEYQERINLHLQHIKKLCAKNRWHYFRHDTGNSLDSALRDLWFMLAGEAAIG